MAGLLACAQACAQVCGVCASRPVPAQDGNFMPIRKSVHFWGVTGSLSRRTSGRSPQSSNRDQEMSGTSRQRVRQRLFSAPQPTPSLMQPPARRWRWRGEAAWTVMNGGRGCVPAPLYSWAVTFEFPIISMCHTTGFLSANLPKWKSVVSRRAAQTQAVGAAGLRAGRR